MKTVRVLKAAEPYVQRIREWFEGRFGFTITARQAVIFSLYTLDSYSGISEHYKAMTLLGLKDMPSFSVRLTDKMEKNIRRFAKGKNGCLPPNTTAFVSACVAYRAMSLPLQ